MIKIENINVFGWGSAIQGMRNPMNSWSNSDSNWGIKEDPSMINPDDEVYFVVGDKDLSLMKRLSKAGNDHAKFLRMIHVQCDITAPLYWIAEHDTYKVGTTRNSCSFMHKGVSKPFELSDFSINKGEENRFIPIIEELNKLREVYISQKNEETFQLIRQLVPSGYNQRYTWDANYQVLKNIYWARRNHRLPEWHDFCDWCLTLPYFKEICVDPFIEE